MTGPMGGALAGLEAAGGLSGVAACLTYWLRRREVQEAGSKQIADVAASLTATSLSLLEPVRAHAAEAERRAVALQSQMAEAEQAIKSLTEALQSSEARSRAEREELQRRLDEACAERDRLAAELARRDSELNGAHLAPPHKVQGMP